jgi:hypothetical protein
MYRLFLALTLLVAAAVSASAQGLPVPSYWLNQRGSEMKLYAINPEGTFQGVFINHSSGFNCQGRPYALTGHEWGHRVVFAVDFPDCNAKAVWFGRVLGNTIRTRWVLHVSDPFHVIRGYDLFTLQP